MNGPGDINLDSRRSPCAVLKVDVEGGELEVMDGFANTLRQDKPIIFFEVLNYFLVVTNQGLTHEEIAFREARNTELMSRLHEHGYRVFNMRPNNALVEVERFSPERVNNLSICDYVALPAGQAETFLDCFKSLSA